MGIGFHVQLSLFFNHGKHIHALAAMINIKNNFPIHEREQSVVPANADTKTGLDAGPVLANKDITGKHKLASIAFHAQALGIRVTTVAACTATFFMSHGYLSYFSIF
jgi:hypothetical protein